MQRIDDRGIDVKINKIHYSTISSTSDLKGMFNIALITNFRNVLSLMNLCTDLSYMKSVYDATDPRLEGQYDYIVIGGGTAGCPLAATLSEKYSVLVLERGGAPKEHPNVLHLGGFFPNLMQDDDGTTPAQRFTSEDGVANVRGRVLGGSSMINAGFYSRGNKEFFSASGVNWDMEAVEKAYEWVEETLVHRPRLTEWQSAFNEALLETGGGPSNGFNLNHNIGTKVSGSTFDEAGRRHGAVELLNRGNSKNLQVAVEATVEKIIFSTKDSSMIKMSCPYYPSMIDAS